VQLVGDDRPIAHRGGTIDRPKDRGDLLVDKGSPLRRTHFGRFGTF